MSDRRTFKKKPKALTVKLTVAEHEQIRLAASLKGLTPREYVVRAINDRLVRQGVDAVLLAEAGRTR